MPNYRVTHQTVYRHAFPAGAAWQMLQLQPRDEPTVQECLDFQLELNPATPDLSTRDDYFGNRHHYFSVREPHRELSITSHATVRRDAPALPLSGLTPTFQDVRQAVRTLIETGEGFELEQFLCATPQVPFLPAAHNLAHDLSEALPILTWLEKLGERFSRDFRFDPSATVVSTPLAEVLEKRRGVCQDFTHAWLSCLRQHGVPAAYVSGYLLTNPPPGQPRLRGADAMHAWVSCFVPELGWIDYDPTNACLVADGHIVVARGRDYSDVSPTSGVFTGSYSPHLRVAVTVEPVE